jgi:FMN reductase [NAD(P)H]
VWIGMIDEQKVMQALVTDLVPGCILSLGYSQKMLHPKPKRKLTELINEI